MNLSTEDGIRVITTGKPWKENPNTIIGVGVLLNVSVFGIPSKSNKNLASVAC